ncbi:hypothetical protein EMIHUDRAFT_258189, partial [Emiliania huxleyi CCMP1516]|uniref:Helicase C-terminal domain-containing protein n=2 Tax=Emiliania huxleyi TaxID=2903 RepID=A0A0D3IBQ9_EMIH1
MDEGDRILNMGLEPQIPKIVPQVEVGDINSLNANKDITQVVHLVDGQAQKASLMSQVFATLEAGSRVIVFTSTKRMCDSLGSQLGRRIGVGVIHGDKDQREREMVLADFKSGRRPVMIATDVAARGIDVKDVKAVINYDFPGNIEDYIHRIGRTGRAGAKGDSNKARPLVDIMLKAGQQLPAQLAQMAGVRHGQFEEADMAALMRPPGDTAPVDEERLGRML